MKLKIVTIQRVIPRYFHQKLMD